MGARKEGRRDGAAERAAAEYGAVLAAAQQAWPPFGGLATGVRRGAFCTEAHAALRDGVAAALGCAAPHELQTVGAVGGRLATRRAILSDAAREAALDRANAAYVRLCLELVRGWDCDRVIFQRLPALRVVPPGPTPRGAPHRDAEYGHQPCMLNFWVPLSGGISEGNTLQVERSVGGKDFAPLVGGFGEYFTFWGAALEHYPVTNRTDATRVSLDFRVVPGPLFDEYFAGGLDTRTGRPRYFVGGYWAAATRDPVTGHFVPEPLVPNATAPPPLAARQSREGDAALVPPVA